MSSERPIHQENLTDYVSRNRYEREVKARQDAERLLEDKSRELYESNVSLERALQSERRIAKLQLEFITAISHEFRTPLTIINGSAGRIAKVANGDTAEQIRARCETIEESVKRLTQLLDSILSVAPNRSK